MSLCTPFRRRWQRWCTSTHSSSRHGFAWFVRFIPLAALFVRSGKSYHLKRTMGGTCNRAGRVWEVYCSASNLTTILRLSGPQSELHQILLMNETNRCTVNFQFLLMAQLLYMFRAVFLPLIRSVISRTTALVQCYAARCQTAVRNRMELQFHPLV